MAWSSPVIAAITVVAVAAMSIGVLLTQGRAVGAREAVVASLDDAGSRTIVVRADAESGLTSSVLDRIDALDDVQWAGAFGPATDVAALPGGTKVPIRAVFANRLDIPVVTPLPGQDAYASHIAMDRLGLVDDYGAVVSRDGTTYGVVGQFTTPDHLRAFEPLLLVPETQSGDEPVALLVVVAGSPAQVTPLAQALTSVLAVADPTAITVTTAEQLAALQTDVDSQLGAFGAALVSGILTLTALLVAALMFGMVTLRRKDFGRRRALGASQELVLTLLLTQATLVGAIGAVGGAVVAIAVLASTGDPIAPVGYVTGVISLAVVTSLLGAVAPAIVASRRDPLHELRVP